MSLVVAADSKKDASRQMPYSGSDCGECYAPHHYSNVAAYLDGELGEAETVAFESHIKSCRVCASALNEQKRVLHALDQAFNALPVSRREASLPKDFTRTLIARAETDMRGVRGKIERRRAVVLASVVFLCALLLLGWASIDRLFSAIATTVRATVALMWTMLQALADVGAGVFVVLRALNHRIIIEAQPHVASVLLMLLFLLVALLLVRFGGYSSNRSE